MGHAARYSQHMYVAGHIELNANLISTQLERKQKKKQVPCLICFGKDKVFKVQKLSSYSINREHA